MKQPVFGRKQSSQQDPPRPSNEAASGGTHPGHAAVLRNLRESEGEKPFQRSQLVGNLLFDMTCKLIASDRGVRVEDLLAILASNGGYSCVLAALDEMSDRARPAGNDLLIVAGKDGHRYFFGDLPNRYLVESPHALLSLALGAVQACGGDVSAAMVEQTMAHVARTVGGDSFGEPQLPAAHRPSDSPFNYIRHLWPRFLDGLKLYEVPPTRWPMTLGFALQRAIEAGKAAIDPALAGRIVIECAVPMAKIDPKRIG